MKWWWSLPVVCTGCLQPNPSFKPGSTTGESETASEAESVADSDTSPTLDTADDDVDSADTHTESSEATSAGTSSTADPTTTDDPTTDEGSDGPNTTGVAGEHTIFVSSADYSGDFAGFGPADDLCTQLANDAGLAGTYLAILSDSTIDARDRIVVTGPVRNVMGELIAENEADLWDGFIAAPVGYTEMGVQFLASPHTGTLADGTNSGENCGDWTLSGGASGTVGDAGYAGDQWIDSGTAGCSQSLPFYCISQ